MNENLDKFIEQHTASRELQEKCMAEARSHKTTSLQQLGSDLTTFGYHHVALEIFLHLVRNNGALSNYINAGIVATRCKNHDTALNILKNALKRWPRDKYLSRQIYDILTIENNAEYIYSIRDMLFDFDYLDNLQKIRIHSNSKSEQELVRTFEEFKFSKSFSLDSLAECLNIVKIGFPEGLCHLPIEDLIRVAPDEGAEIWRKLMLAVYREDHISVDFIKSFINEVDPNFLDVFDKLLAQYNIAEAYDVKFGGINFMTKISFVILSDHHAIKVVWCKDKYYPRKFWIEKHVLETLSLPYIPEFFANIHHEHFFVQIIGRVPGLPLASIRKKLPYKTFLEIEEKLKEIHARGFIHGDLSPWNVLIEEREVSIIDFGDSENMSEMGRAMDIRFLQNLRGYFLDK